MFVDFTDQQYFSSLFELFHPTIKEHVLEGFENILADGQCGYRCCSELLNLDVDNGWRVIRNNILREPSEIQELYSRILGDGEGYKKVWKALNFFEIYNAHTKYWMQFSDMGCLFASAFNCILCVFSPKQSLTYFPLRTGPTTTVQIVPVVSYDDNHFMKVILKEGAPLPPVLPGWRMQRYPDAEQWADVVKMRIFEWRMLIGDSPTAKPSFVEII